MRLFDVKIDRRGWAQDKRRRPPWRANARARINARRDLPWTPAEDRDLLRRVAGANSIGYADPTIRAAEIAHGRSYCSIVARLAGLRLAMFAKQAASRVPLKKGQST